MQNIQAFIETTLASELHPTFLQVEDESNQHNVAPGAQSHFKVTVVSKEFEEKRLLQRHRIVNALLADALAGPVHALALHTYTDKEWVARNGESMKSPPCLGGSKLD